MGFFAQNKNKILFALKLLFFLPPSALVAEILSFAFRVFGNSSVLHNKLKLIPVRSKQQILNLKERTSRKYRKKSFIGKDTLLPIHKQMLVKVEIRIKNCTESTAEQLSTNNNKAKIYPLLSSVQSIINHRLNLNGAPTVNADLIKLWKPTNINLVLVFHLW